MAASRTRDGLTGGYLNVLPLICSKVVDRCLIGSIALLEPSEDDHLCSLEIDDSRVLVSEQDLVTASPNQRPCHRS